MLTCAICLTLAACEKPAPELVFVVPDIPENLRQLEVLPDRKAETLTDVGLILTDHIEAVENYEDKITSRNCIIDNSKAGEPTDDCVSEISE